MADVTLRVIVQDQQVQNLQQRINQLNQTQITLNINSDSLKTMNTRLYDADKRSKNLTESQKELQSQIGFTTQAFENGAEKVNQNTQAMGENRKTADKYQKSQRQSAAAVNDHNSSLDKQGVLYDILGRSLTSFIARMTAYRAVYAGIRAITNGFTEALQTLKAVDDELVTVRKVTGFDAYQMADVEAAAYSVASRYGVNASEYVSGVAEFARAGYKELSGQLAELAQKTQIVGDTTADVANQFLLSVDAAYKYEGSVEKLNAVLDGANELDNKYATSIEKIAQGMGIVAPVAAQMHVGIDELAASIGTITAVTQRSGSETARALRALFLNIVGDTKTEIDEGVTWTTGEIAGLRDVIKEYAKDAYDAAQATGSIIDPMKAMEGLSKSLKDGLLTEQELMEMVSDIGGKLRTSQLLALINNWDMYESMLEDYRNAAGSADKEIENAMDSWTRKTNVLKNTWTEFIKTGMDSSLFKGALDLLTEFVKGLDSLPGVLTRILMLVAAFNLPNIATSVTDLVTSFRNLNTGLTATGGILAAVAVAWSAVSFAVEKYKQQVDEQIRADRKATEESAASISVSKDRMTTLEQLRTKYSEVASSAQTEAEKDRALTDLKYDLIHVYGLEESAISNVNDLRREGLKLIDEENRKELERALATGAAGYNEATRRQNNASNQSRVLIDYTDIETAREYEKIISSIIDDFEVSYRGYDKRAGGKDEEEIRLVGSIQEKIDALTKLINTLQAKDSMSQAEKTVFSAATKELEALNKIVNETQPIIDDYNELLARSELYQRNFGQAIIENVDDLKNYKEWLTKTYDGDDAILNIMLRLVDEAFPSLEQAVEDVTESIAEENKHLFSNQQALDDTADSTKRLQAAKSDAEAAVRQLLPVLFDEEGKLTDVGAQALASSQYLADLVAAEIDLQNETAQANYANIVMQLASVSREALLSARAILMMVKASEVARNAANTVLGLFGSSGLTAGELNLTGDVQYAYNLLQQLDALEAQMGSYSYSGRTVAPYTSGSSSSSSGRTSGGSGGRTSGSSSSSGRSSSSTEDPHLTELRDRVSLERSVLNLMQAQGASAEEQAAQIQRIMDAIQEEADYMTSIGSSQTEINNLMADYYNWQNKYNDLLREEAEIVEEIAPPTAPYSLDREGMERTLRQESYDRQMALLRSELNLANVNGSSTEQRISIMRQIQSLLHEQADYLRSIGADQADINALSTEWWRIEDQISDLMDGEAQSAERQAEALERAVDAENALLNVQRQRNVHYYNAATGQWEWSANPTNLRNAQENFNGALEDLPMSARYYYHRTGRMPTSMGQVQNYLNGGTKNYGATYNIGGINISEQDAKSMSLYQLLQLSKSLGIYNQTA